MRRAPSLLAILVAGISLAAPGALVTPARAAELTGFAAHAPSADPSTGSFGIRLVDAPVSEAADSRAWTYIIDDLHPGTVIHRRVAVENMTSQVAHVRVYPDAATISGGAFIGDAGQTRGELTTWTSVSYPVLTLAPRASALDMVTIRVPRDAVRGERYEVIWAQEASRVRENSHFAVTEVNRVGVRVYLAVGPGGALPTNFAITSVTAGRASGGAPEVIAHVRDTGQRAIDLSGTLSLSGGPGGASAGPFRFTSGLTLAPGQSGVMREVLSKTTPNGSWHVTVTLHSGLTTRQAQAVIQFTGLRTTGMILPRRALLAGGVVVVILIAAGWLIGRRLRWRLGPRRI